MIDIAMCDNKTCPLVKKCYRFNAKASEPYQAYSQFRWNVKADRITCDGFIPMPKPRRRIPVVQL